MPIKSRAKTQKDYYEKVIMYRNMGMDIDLISENINQNIEFVNQIIEIAIANGSNFPKISIKKHKLFKDIVNSKIVSNFAVSKPQVTVSNYNIKYHHVTKNFLVPKGFWLFNN